MNAGRAGGHDSGSPAFRPDLVRKNPHSTRRAVLPEEAREKSRAIIPEGMQAQRNQAQHPVPRPGQKGVR